MREKFTDTHSYLSAGTEPANKTTNITINPLTQKGNEIMSEENKHGHAEITLVSNADGTVTNTLKHYRAGERIQCVPILHSHVVELECPNCERLLRVAGYFHQTVAPPDE